MGLLYPSVNQFDNQIMFPIISNNEFPWELFDPKNNNSLANQILKLNLKSVGVFQNPIINPRVSLNYDHGPIYIHKTAKIDEEI